MDTIEFRLSAFRYNGNKIPTAVADIYVNGQPLFEKFFMENAPIPVAELHENLSAKYKDEAVQIFGCGCGATLCCPVFVTVRVGADTVVWTDFLYEDDTKSVGEFVFDKTQYFREVDKLKRWRETDSLIVEYGGVECGYITLVVMKGAQAYNFYFDELLDDPLPALVNFFNAVRNGDDFAEAKLMRYDDRVDFKLSFKLRTDGQLRFVAELVWHKVTLCEYVSRDELADMLKRIFDDLLTDKYFPYSYPCFWYICEESDPDSKITDAIEAEHPDWPIGDVLNYAVDSGRLKLVPCYEEFLAKYRRMLTDYVVPEGWL